MANPNAPVYEPNLGMYLGQARLSAPPRALVDSLDVRVREGRLVRDNFGWTAFPDSTYRFNLDMKPVTLVSGFAPQDSPKRTIFGNTTDLFTVNLTGDALKYITPTYITGSVTVVNNDATVTGAGTTWTTNVKAGDFIFIGADDEDDPLAGWYEVDTVTDNTHLELTEPYAGANDAGLPYTIRQTFTGDHLNPFMDEYFLAADNVGPGSPVNSGDRWYATNGIDPIVAWSGVDGDVCYRPSLGDITTCNAIRKWKGMLVYLGLVLSGGNELTAARFSAVGLPEDVVTNGAIQLTIHDRDEPLINAYPIGDALAFYSLEAGKNAPLTVAQFVGGEAVVALRQIVGSRGPRSARGIFLFPDHHQYLSSDGMYVFDGAVARPVNGHVWDDTIRGLQPSRYPLIQAIPNVEQGEVMWTLPRTTDLTDNPTLALTQNYRERVGDRNPQPHTFMTIPATASGLVSRSSTLTFAELDEMWSELNIRWNDQSLQSAFPQLVFGTLEGDLFVYGASNLRDGEAFESYAVFSRRALGTSRAKGTIRRIYPYVEEIDGSDSAAIEVSVFTADFADGTQTLQFTDSFPIDAEAGTFLSPRVTGRFATIGIRSTTDYSGYWAVLGYELLVVPAGARDSVL